MRWVIAVMFAASLAACAGPQVRPEEVANKPVTLSAAQTTAVQKGVRDILKDPASAQFGTLVAGESADGHIAVCGYVNAKNSYGGYTGKKPFIGAFNGAQFVASSIGGSDIEVLSVMQVCQKYGLPL